MSVTIPANNLGKGLQILAAYAGANVKFDVKDTFAAKGSKGDALEGVTTVYTFVASQTEKGKALLGATAEIAAEVDQWMSYRNTNLTPLLDTQLIAVNDALLTRAFIAGNAVTIADFAYYATVHEACAAFTAPQRAQFSNLMRWFDFCQHVLDGASVLPKVKIALPKYVKPAPVAAAPAADKKGDAKKEEKKGGDKAAAPAPAAAPAKEEKKGGDKAAKGEAKPAAPAAAKEDKKGGEKKEAAPAGEKKEKEKKEGGEKKGGEKKAAAAPTSPEDEERVDQLDIRVGTIVKVGKHPDADALYLEEIDVGEEAPRQVISGLVKFVPVEQMQNRRVAVVCNLKPAKMRGIMSYGMVLCASNADHTVVEPLKIPEGVPNGERIVFEGYDKAPEAEINPKKKIWEKIAPHLKTDAKGTAVFKGVPFMSSKGALTATLADAVVA